MTETKSKKELTLLALQVAVSQARVKHEELADRHRVFVLFHYDTSARIVKRKLDKAHAVLIKAQNALLAFYKKHPEMNRTN